MNLLLDMISDALTRIFRDEGVEGLWSGTMSSLVLVSNPAIHFMVYEAIKRYMGRLALGRVSCDYLYQTIIKI